MRGVASGGGGRIEAVKGTDNPVFARRVNPSEQHWNILEAVRTVADGRGRSPAEVALAWVRGQPGVTSTLIGATQLGQLDNNLRSLELELTPLERARLNGVSALESVHPYMYFGEIFQGMIHGGATVRRFE